LSLIRRTLAKRHLKANEIPFTFTSFPRLGTHGIFTEPHFSSDDAKSSHSLFLPDEITNPHARFPSVPGYFDCTWTQNLSNLFSTLTANIRSRRGSKVAINLPIFIDEKTPRPFVDPTIPWQRAIYQEDPGKCNPIPFTESDPVARSDMLLGNCGSRKTANSLCCA
jgi:glutamate--cysteine ligase catalytic subunit